MTSQAPERPKLFTIEQANAMLPLVQAIVADLVKLARDVAERRQRLTMLMGDRSGPTMDPYREELEQVQQELEKDAERLREYVRELEELGVETKDPLVGLVDFPCVIQGELVYLCWQLGEPRIEYWHALDAGFAGRQPLTKTDFPDAEAN